MSEKHLEAEKRRVKALFKELVKSNPDNTLQLTHVQNIEARKRGYKSWKPYRVYLLALADTNEPG